MSVIRPAGARSKKVAWLAAAALVAMPVQSALGATPHRHTLGTTWSAQPTPNRTQPNGLFLGVSCPAQGWCMAVGDSVNPSGRTVVLAESWNGTGWKVLATPRLNPAGSAELDGVSCTSATSCLAVGSVSYDGQGQTKGQQPLAESWNGTAWAVVPVTVPGATGQLTAVSCATTCLVLGSATTAAGAPVVVVERWNGTGWFTIKPPAPRTDLGALSLRGVACAQVCVVVGAHGGHTFAATLTGRTWTIEVTPDQGAGALDGVTCPSPGDCVAVGWAKNHQRPLVETWNGAVWAVGGAAAPTASYSELDAVSCSSATACVAVGQSGGEYLAESFDGSTWTIDGTPHVSSGTGSALASVGCAPTADCLAVGSWLTVRTGQQRPLADDWVPGSTSWASRRPRSPFGATQSELAAVSCTSDTACLAVGGAGALAETWDGQQWRVAKAVYPRGATAAAFDGVSCGAPGSCIAVGTEIVQGSSEPLIESWSTTGWQPMTPAAVPGELFAVSCSSTVSCVAVGDQSSLQPGVGPSPFAESWDGTSWTALTAPDPGAFGELLGVSCTPTATCTAVGYTTTSDGNGSSPLAESWDGAAWTVQSVPAVTNGAIAPELDSVACPSTTSCVAVGVAAGLSSESPIVETWNGTAWTADSSQDQLTGDSLFAVSCPTAGSCVAVGNGLDTTAVGGMATFAEAFGGTAWTPVTPPAIAGSAGSLSGISCADATGCEAVGWASYPGQGADAPQVTLADAAS